MVKGQGHLGLALLAGNELRPPAHVTGSGSITVKNLAGERQKSSVFGADASNTSELNSKNVKTV